MEYLFSLSIFCVQPAVIQLLTGHLGSYYCEPESTYKESCLNSALKLNYGQNSIFFIVVCLYSHIKLVFYTFYLGIDY